MDLFYGNSIEEQLKALRKDIKNWAKVKYNYDFGNKRVFIAYGKLSNIANNLLIITPNLLSDSKPFEDKNCTYLKNLLLKHNITNYFLTPNFIVPKEKVTSADIKEYSRVIQNIVDILQPKLIVVLDEESCFSFFKRKFILRDFHGQSIGKSKQGINIILTYSPIYYTDITEYGDPSYKNFIQDSDWSIISNLYRGLIK